MDGKLQSLQTRYERLKANCIINVANYAEWDHDDVSDWLVNIDQGAYVRYEGVIRKELANVDMSGASLVKCTKNDLKGFGIKQKAHQNAIWMHIQALEHPPAEEKVQNL